MGTGLQRAHASPSRNLVLPVLRIRTRAGVWARDSERAHSGEGWTWVHDSQRPVTTRLLSRNAVLPVVRIRVRAGRGCTTLNAL